MTTGANSLTERASRAAAARRGDQSWTMAANDLRVVVSGLERLGYVAKPLLVTAGLANVRLDDPDARISCEAMGALLSGALKQRFIPNLGLELAQVTELGAYPLLDYLVVTSDSVGAGARQLAQYFRLTSSPVTITVHEDDDPIRVEMASMAPMPFAIEYVAGLLVRHFGTETSGRFAPVAVALRHVPDDIVAFERIVGCPVAPTASWSGVSVSRDVWRLPLRRGDPVLRGVLEAQADSLLARLPPCAGVARDAQRLLVERLAGGEVGMRDVARALAMSVRTLQRRLAAEGVSFQRLLEEARKESAARHVSESRLSIGEIAFLLGYSEPAPFHRAFKRWYGMTPDRCRQRRPSR